MTNGSRSLRKTGETLTVGGVITDQTGSRGGSLGAGGLIVRGTGTVALAADNGVTGGTTIDAGATLDLAVNGAAGQGGVTFDTGSVLQIGAGVAVGNTVFGFAAGDLFDFRGIGPASNTTATIDNAMYRAPCAATLSWSATSSSAAGRDVSAPERPVWLEVLDNGETIACVLANAYRTDLEQAGLGSGRHAFSVRARRLSGHVEVRRAADRMKLPAGG